MLRAFSDDRYDYYKLTTSLGHVNNKEEWLLPVGTIFVHDTDDHERGSISNGCLKLCWTPDGNTYSSLCGGTVIFHADFINTSLFELVKPKKDTKAITILKTAISNLKTTIEEMEKQLKTLIK